MADQGTGHAVPSVTIDEALELFLGIAYPQGLPEGADREAIKATLRERIAKDRPDWAGAYAPRPPVEPAGPSYSDVKAAAVEQARQADLPPTDPEERYLYMRRQEARQASETRKAEAREAGIRADLVARLMASRKPPHPADVEQVLTIRRELAQRLGLGGARRLDNGEVPSPSPALRPESPELAGIALSHAPLRNGEEPAEAHGRSPAITHIQGMAMRSAPLAPGSQQLARRAERQLETRTAEPPERGQSQSDNRSALKAALDGQQARLQPRESLLAPRRPPRIRETLPDRTRARNTGLTLEGAAPEEAAASGTARSRAQGLSLDAPTRPGRTQLWPESTPSTPRRSRGLTLE